ncbi:MAG: methionine--tRNA ligase subunit beta, partial [Promethearchaeota archaeon]
RPEKSDTSFLWSEFENNIKLLNDVIGNFIHRTLTFINKQFKGKVPNIIELDDKDKQFLEQINSIGKTVCDLLERFELRSALREIVSFAQIGNVYLNEKAPWHLIKENKALAGQVFNTCVQAVHALSILLAPFIPDTSQKILEFLNLETSLDEINWENISNKALKSGHPIKKAKPLFEKLDIEEMKKKLEIIRKCKKEMKEKPDLISYEKFKRLDIRVAKILEVEPVPKTKSLLKLTIDIGTEKRTIVAGLAQYYTPKELKNKQIVVLANLEPKKLRGIESQGMLLAAVDGEKVSILTPDKEIKVGARIE